MLSRKAWMTFCWRAASFLEVSKPYIFTYKGSHGKGSREKSCHALCNVFCSVNHYCTKACIIEIISSAHHTLVHNPSIVDTLRCHHFYKPYLKMQFHSYRFLFICGKTVETVGIHKKNCLLTAKMLLEGYILACMT